MYRHQFTIPTVNKPLLDGRPIQQLLNSFLRTFLDIKPHLIGFYVALGSVLFFPHRILKEKPRVDQFCCLSQNQIPLLIHT